MFCNHCHGNWLTSFMLWYYNLITGHLTIRSYPICLVPIPHLLDSNANQRCTSPPSYVDYVRYSCFSLTTSSVMNVMTTYYSFRCASTRTATERQCGLGLCYTLLDSELTWTCTHPPPQMQIAFACECDAFLKMLWQWTSPLIETWLDWSVAVKYFCTWSGDVLSQPVSV